MDLFFSSGQPTPNNLLLSFLLRITTQLLFSNQPADRAKHVHLPRYFQQGRRANHLEVFHFPTKRLIKYYLDQCNDKEVFEQMDKVIEIEPSLIFSKKLRLKGHLVSGNTHS